MESGYCGRKDPRVARLLRQRAHQGEDQDGALKSAIGDLGASNHSHPFSATRDRRAFFEHAINQLAERVLVLQPWMAMEQERDNRTPAF